MSWAPRLKRVFGIDIKTCQTCGCAVRILACIDDPVVLETILTHLDKPVAATAADALARLIHTDKHGTATGCDLDGRGTVGVGPRSAKRGVTRTGRQNSARDAARR